MYRIVESQRFYKKALKLFKKNPTLLKKYEKTLALLEKDPYHPSLRLHKFQGELKEFYSVSIDMSYRLIIDFIIQDDRIILLDIGLHDDVY
ncbi:MAG: plasmid stabilization protein [Epsilonproteobacteria bacterium]|nr:plasmid stabilization protein [Campylobacterota bacterium]NPA64315.1 plasmid stabilization protein [Campylobacterota bacterium]